jgi:hypothetical protein
MNGKGMTITLAIFGILFVTLVCGGLDPFAIESAEQQRQMEQALGGERQVLNRAIAQQKEIEKPRYPDFTGAIQIENGIWDCRNSSYGGSQFWTTSGPNAVFACDPLLQAYAFACDEVIINPSGTDDSCILDGIIINITITIE